MEILKDLKDIGKHLWKVILCVGIIVTLLVGIWAIDTRYVIRELFEIAQASDVKAREAIQVQFMKSGALDRLFYWQRVLLDLKVRREQNPSDRNIQEGINEAQRQINAIQVELKEIQKLK